jgi:hypothetical protein
VNDCLRRAIPASHRDAGRDLVVGDIADHDGGRSPEIQ